MSKKIKKALRDAANETPEAAAQLPWSVSSELPVHYNYKMSAQTHAKMGWIKDNVPRHSSIQKILDSIVLDGIELLLEKHYKI